MAAKKQLRAQKGVGVTPSHKPVCHTHNETMKFEPTRMVWTCPVPHCNMVAHPPTEVGGAKSQGFSGEFEAIAVHDRSAGEDERIVIRQGKVFFDMTDHLMYAAATSDGFAVTLVFDNVLRFDKDGNEM